MTLADWQVAIDELVLGSGTKYRLGAFDHAKPESRLQDAVRPRADGVRFGRDYLNGTVFTLELLLLGDDPADTFDLLSALSAAWDAQDVRTVPGATVPLRFKFPGRDTRRVWGRPRKFAPSTLKNAINSHIPVVCDFKAQDPYFYDDTEQSVTVTLVPPDAQTGISVPFTVPFSFAGESVSEVQVAIGGAVAAPVKLRINGPVTDPKVTVLGQWYVALTGSLASDDYVTVDPFNRTVLTRFGENWAGRFTAESQPLPDISLAPGTYDVTLRGTDPTGTASLDVLWRDTYASL